ncbi:MAG: hypothetical protein GWN00_01000 [Aliifodinibius sp.]|nr:hypothetical protein [Fodinibius sp.]NIV09908.1 hypothetical protein [Fodinibius sp.]NIY23438.1 hypothetical protein [Fodinibius sp.]
MKLTKESFQVKNVKATAIEGELAYTASFYVNGKRVCAISDAGYGAGCDYKVLHKALFSQVEDYINSVGEVTTEHGTLPYTFEWMIGQLINEFQENKKLKVWCKTKTVMQLPGDPAGQYRTVDYPFTPAVKQFLNGKYPDAIIINERF